jgi:uncharacterized protein YdhG (YjbR/CyaY superfamily)
MIMDKKVIEYFDNIPEGRKALINELHSIIIKLFPEITINFDYKMPTYRLGNGWIALANQKSYVSLYTCGYHHIKEFKEKHPKIKSGKGCINLKIGDSIPVNDLKKVIKHAIEHPKTE